METQRFGLVSNHTLHTALADMSIWGLEMSGVSLYLTVFTGEKKKKKDKLYHFPVIFPLLY